MKTTHFKNKNIYLFLVLMASFATASCAADYTVDVVYSYGIMTINFSSLDDFAKIDQHIKGFNLPPTPVAYKGTGKSDSAAIADGQSKANKDIKQWLAKFKNEDFAALGLRSDTYFRWVITCVNDGSIVGEYKWNM